MWLVVEEVTAHQLVMSWIMVFDVVVPEVGDSGTPVNIEVDLAGAIPDTVGANANHLRPFLLDCIICRNNCYSVISLHGSEKLGVYEFLEVRADC